MDADFDTFLKIVSSGGTGAIAALIYVLWRLEKRLSRLEVQVTVFLALLAGRYNHVEDRTAIIARAAGDAAAE